MAKSLYLNTNVLRTSSQPQLYFGRIDDSLLIETPKTQLCLVEPNVDQRDWEIRKLVDTHFPSVLLWRHRVWFLDQTYLWVIKLCWFFCITTIIFNCLWLMVRRLLLTVLEHEASEPWRGFSLFIVDKLKGLFDNLFTLNSDVLCNIWKHLIYLLLYYIVLNLLELYSQYIPYTLLIH